VWGIGEPIGPGSSDATLVECQLHESLLNVAFADTPRFRLLCPYDTDALEPAVLAEAHRSHPVIRHDGVRRGSAAFRGLNEAAAPCDLPLSPPAPDAHELAFDEPGSLPAIRRYAQQRAGDAGLDTRRTADLVLAVNELVANSLVHGGGKGVLRIWEQREVLLVEVADTGRFRQPLAGRRPPAPARAGGWGLWLANQLCDLVQVRSYRGGSVVRLHMGR
jgi:anti-sigma regulatory factor (Ser/Thr protein kinase)